jgi:hypothetical protein
VLPEITGATELEGAIAVGVIELLVAVAEPPMLVPATIQVTADPISADCVV